MERAPLVLTLELDEESFARLDALRVRHFPAHRNHIPAHLTLFHALPGTEERAIAETLRHVSRDTAPLVLEAAALRFLGTGSAYEIASAGLEALRRDLAARWQGWLTPQDAQGFRPHVTIQNKAASAEAKVLFGELSASFSPFTAAGTALLLWHYRGGPWEPAGRFPFHGSGATGAASTRKHHHNAL